MYNMARLLIVFLCFNSFCLGDDKVPSFNVPEFKRVCYFTNWSCDLLVKEAHFCLRHIDASLCSHIIYSFVDINVTSLSLTPSRVDDETKDGIMGRYVLFNRLKESNPRLKTLLSVGGSYQSEGFKAVTSSNASRKEFASNSVAYVRRWGFDGLDVDWEYPDDGESLTLLLQDLRQSDDSQRKSSTDHPLILSVAGPASEDLVEKGFLVKNISRYVDFINLMAYDLQGSWSRVTGFNSPLYPRVNDSRFTPEHCVEWVVKMWMRRGAPLSKIVLGIAGYGQSYTLAAGADRNGTHFTSTTTTKDSNNSLTTSVSETTPATSTGEGHQGPGSSALGPGRPGRLRHLDGQLAYSEICEYVTKGGHVSWDAQQRVPFMSFGDLWVGYDDTRSVTEKVTWAHTQGLGGVMFWSLDLDDFKGNYCNQGRYPLLTAISNTVISLADADLIDNDFNDTDNVSTEYVNIHGEIRPVVTDERKDIHDKSIGVDNNEMDDDLHHRHRHNTTVMSPFDENVSKFGNNRTHGIQIDTFMGNLQYSEEKRSSEKEINNSTNARLKANDSFNNNKVSRRRSDFKITKANLNYNNNNKKNEHSREVKLINSNVHTRNTGYRMRRRNQSHQTTQSTSTKEHRRRSRNRTNRDRDLRNTSSPRRSNTKRNRDESSGQYKDKGMKNNTISTDSNLLIGQPTSDRKYHYGDRGDKIKNTGRHRHHSTRHTSQFPRSTLLPTTKVFGGLTASKTPSKSSQIVNTESNVHTSELSIDFNSPNTGITSSPVSIQDGDTNDDKETVQSTTTTKIPDQIDRFSVYDNDQVIASSEFEFYYIAFKLPDVPLEKSTILSATSVLTSAENAKDYDDIQMNHSLDLRTKENGLSQLMETETNFENKYYDNLDRVITTTVTLNAYSSSEIVHISLFYFTSMFAAIMVLSFIF